MAIRRVLRHTVEWAPYDSLKPAVVRMPTWTAPWDEAVTSNWVARLPWQPEDGSPIRKRFETHEEAINWATEQARNRMRERLEADLSQLGEHPELQRAIREVAQGLPGSDG